MKISHKRLIAGFITGFFTAATSANLILDNMFVGGVNANIFDAPGQTTTYIENGYAAPSGEPYSYAFFSPDANDINGPTYYREQVTAGYSSVFNTTVFRASNVTDILVGNPADADTGFGMTIENTSGEGAQLGIFNSSITGTPYVYFNDMTYGFALSGYDALDTAQLGDYIWLSIYNGYGGLYPSYSFDGVNYITAEEWDSVAHFGSAPIPGTTPTDAQTTAFGQTVVPVPAAAWLFASALAGLGLTRRNRK